MRERVRSVGVWTGNWPVTTLLLALCLASEGAFAQSWERAYDASIGTLPSAQGWNIVTADPAPADGLGETNYSVVAGALVHGDTGGVNADLGNRQWHEVSLPVIDFENEHLLVEARLRVVNSTGTAPDDVPLNVRPDAGFDIWLSDEHEDSFQMGIASDFVMFRKWTVGNEPFADFDTTDGFHTYEIRIAGDAAVARRSAIPNCRRNPGMQDCADQLIGVSHPAQLKCFAWGARRPRDHGHSRRGTDSACDQCGIGLRSGRTRL